MLEEVGGEITPDRLPWRLAFLEAEVFGDELKILVQMLGRPSCGEKLLEPIGNVVGKPIELG